MTSDIDINRLYAEAAVALQSEHYMNAIIMFTKVLDAIRYRYYHGSDATGKNCGIPLDEVYACRALSWMGKKEYDIALLDINEALRESPREPRYYCARAQIRQELFQYGPAICDLSIAIEEDRHIADYYYQRSCVYFCTSDYPAALNDIKEAIKLDAEIMRYYIQRAKVFFKQKQYESALNDCEKILNSDTPCVESFCIAGEIHLELKDFDQAKEMLRKAGEFGHAPADNFSFQAKYYFAHDDFEKARFYCDRHLETNPRCWETMLLRGECYEANGDMKHAEIDYKLAHRWHPNSEAVVKKLRDICLQRQDYQSAKEWGVKLDNLKHRTTEVNRNQ